MEINTGNKRVIDSDMSQLEQRLSASMAKQLESAVTTGIGGTAVKWGGDGTVESKPLTFEDLQKASIRLDKQSIPARGYGQTMSGRWSNQYYNYLDGYSDVELRPSGMTLRKEKRMLQKYKKRYRSLSSWSRNNLLSKFPFVLYLEFTNNIYQPQLLTSTEKLSLPSKVSHLSYGEVNGNPFTTPEEYDMWLVILNL